MYYALYRKWRPITFADVIGQEHITTTLRSQVRSNSTTHAYLFTGTRGTGKTTCAKILSRAINCLNPVDGDPCNTCDVCRGILNESIMDVMEIDAASNNGVENIRNIRDEIVYTPAYAKKRVYIIDEVHMLSGGAFNALLKTLEEPPSHAMFILATTEIQKVPATILSRCQRFNFNRIDSNDIYGRLKIICNQEQIDIEDGALHLLSTLADGSMRDGLSILEMCRNTNTTVTEQYLRDMVGLVDTNYTYELISGIIKNDVGEVLSTFNEIYKGSKDTALLCQELINTFRNILIYKSVKEPQKILNNNDINKLSAEKSSEQITLEKAIMSIGILEETLVRMARTNVDKRCEFEMALIKLASPRMSSTNEALLTRIAELENKITLIQNGTVTVLQSKDKPKNKIKQEQTKENVVEIEEQHETTLKEASFATEAIDYLKQLKEYMVVSNLQLAIMSVNDNVVYLHGQNDMVNDILSKNDTLSIIGKAITVVTGKVYNIKVGKQQITTAKSNQEVSIEQNDEGFGSLFDENDSLFEISDDFNSN